MSEKNNLDALIERILAKARDEADVIIDRAQKGSEREIAQAEEQAQKRLAAAEAALREAMDQRKRAVLADVRQKEMRTVMNAREEAVESVFAEALQELAQTGDEAARRALLVDLVAEAIRALGADAVRVRLNAAELALVRGGFPKEIDGVPVAIDDETIEVSGGPVVSDVDGRVVFENTFAARLARRHDALRAQVAQQLGLT